MDILEQVKAILVEQNPQEKDCLLEQLSQVLEYHHGLNEADIVEVVRLLLFAALREDNKAVREIFFSTIETALAYHDINGIDWDQLVAALPSLGKWELEYVLGILEIAGRARYLPALEEYAHHADPEIREWAKEAITEIEYRDAHAPVTQKEAVS